MGTFGSPSRTRTCDHSINSRMLYQLSYRGSCRERAYSTISRLGKRQICCSLGGRKSLRPCRIARRRELRHDPAMLDLARHPELLTPDEMREADRLAISMGTAGIDLMERAGRAVADEAVRLAPSAGRVAVLCGPGANGGDGFIAARILRRRGYRVSLALAGSLENLRGDAAEAARRFDGPVPPISDLDLGGSDLIIDALYGAGLDRDLTGEALALVERINSVRQSGRRSVLSVDLPSGLDGATGQPRGAAVLADVSVTFFRPKPGHLLLPGRSYCGRLAVADIGIPKTTLDAIAPKTFANAPALWRDQFPRLDAADHKYSRGHAVVVSGNAHHTGASRMTARAALRAGAGLVTLASPPDAIAINAAHETAVMVAPFEGAAGLAAILSDRRRNTIAMGPGLGVGAASEALVSTVLSGALGAVQPRRVVLDADALTSFAGRASHLAALIKSQDAQAVMTPHDGEFSRLFKEENAIAQAPSKLTKARKAAAFCGAVVVLKGADTVVAAPDGRAAIGYDLPPTLATAGSGDVLAGFITGLLAQGMSTFEAACCGVWLHGAAARAFGPGLIAEDLPEALPAALRDLALQWR
jgi:ADP-dependent NAD(P)H-hydrate dehydratase / NAD(P)H-hydrate epimerase